MSTYELTLYRDNKLLRNRLDLWTPHTDDMRFERKIKLTFLKLFINSLSKYLIFKRIACMQWLFRVIYQN